MDNHAQNNGQVFATQNNGQVFATQFPFDDQGTPRPTYPPPYVMNPQQQNASTTGKCKNILAGRISVIWLGSLLLVFGAMSQAGAAVAMRYSAGLSELGAGFWCGYMFMAGGAVAIAVGHHETRNLIIGTIFASALTIVASIILLAITATGLTSDNDSYNCYPLICDPRTPWQHCPCYFDDWESSAFAANSTIIGAAALALVAGVWLLVVACIAIRRNPASFQDGSVPAPAITNAAQPNFSENIPHQQDVSVPAQAIANAAHCVQPNFSENLPHQQAYSVGLPVQQVQQPQQQLISLSHPLPSNTAHQPTFSQVMQMPTSYFPYQTIPNQQVFQVPVPVQLILSTSQPNVPEEIRNQQMHSIPIQYVLQQQYQQQTPLNHLQHYNIAPSTLTPQGQENHVLTQADHDDVVAA